jgi:cob(I)alamin adenosyltransferase
LADPKYTPENEIQDQLKTPRVRKNMIEHLEITIDQFEMQLDPINFFILPGGSIESSLLQISRSVARRTETVVARLSENERINPHIIVYLNRLSDLLFVCGRLVNKRLGIKDIAWKPLTLK